MKKFVFIISALVVSVYLFGCAEEEQPTTTTLEGATEILQPMGNIPSNLMPGAGGTLKIGSVFEQQTALKIADDANYYKGRIDDKKGSLTIEATKDFQKAHNLEADGKVGPKTWALLVKYIQDIQIALKNAGYYTGPIDGIIGRQTTKAIQDFQKENNLQVDGKVEPETWDLLSQYLNSAPTTSKPSKKR